MAGMSPRGNPKTVYQGAHLTGTGSNIASTRLKRGFFYTAVDFSMPKPSAGRQLPKGVLPESVFPTVEAFRFVPSGGLATVDANYRGGFYSSVCGALPYSLGPRFEDIYRVKYSAADVDLWSSLADPAVKKNLLELGVK